MWINERMQRRKTHCAHSDDGARSESSHGPARTLLVDFSQAALYMPAAQVVGTLVLIAGCNVACSWISHAFDNVSAVRAAALASALALFCGWSPAQVTSHSAGVEAMFDCLRPALLLYLAAVVVEQLGHSCAGAPIAAAIAAPAPQGWNNLRTMLFHAAAVCMLAAGLVQSYRPRSATDYPFVAVAASLGLVALMPPPPRFGLGPLCDAPGPWAAAERVCRAALFGCVYSALAYAAEPRRHSLSEITLCAARAGVGSLWVLCAHTYLLPVALLQAGFAGWSRASQSSYEQQLSTELRGLAESEEYDAEFAGDFGVDFGNEYSDYGESREGAHQPDSPRNSFRVPSGGLEGFDALNGFDSDMLGEHFAHEDLQPATGCESAAHHNSIATGASKMPSKHVMQRVAEQLLQQGA